MTMFTSDNTPRRIKLICPHCPPRNPRNRRLGVYRILTNRSGLLWLRCIACNHCVVYRGEVVREEDANYGC